jgi:single-strand DNA-binding protein
MGEDPFIKGPRGLRVVSFWVRSENAAASLSKGSRAIVFGRLEQRDYENREGEKRSVVEVVAEEVGASLRWAQAQIERTQRSEGGAPRGPAGGAGPSRTPDPVYGDEEPF